MGSLVIVLLQIFSWFWQWNTFENRLYLVKVRRTKHDVPQTPNRLGWGIPAHNSPFHTPQPRVSPQTKCLDPLLSGVLLSLPLPSPLSLLFSFIPSTLPFLLPRFFLPLPLSRARNPAGIWNSAVSFPIGSGQSPAPKRFMPHFQLNYMYRHLASWMN